MPDIGALLEQHLGPIAATSKRVADQLEAEAETRSKLRGVKPIRLPLLIGTGTSPFTLGGDVTPAGGMNATPDPGYVWSIRHLVIEGLTSGATPDVVNILRNGRIVWQLNGNVFCQTWGKGEMLINAGETLAYASVGTFAATGKIIIHGMAVEVPGEMVGKFYA